MNLKVIIASQSPVKINAVKIGFEKMFPENRLIFEAVSSPSGVSHQPLSDIETFKGAKNRCEYAMVSKSDADFWVGIEGGLEFFQDEYQAFAWIYIKSGAKVGKARTATFCLPRKISQLVKQGLELGEADDMVFGLKDSKKKNGAIGILTHDITNRTLYYSEALILALIPFVNNDLYK